MKSLMFTLLFSFCLISSFHAVANESALDIASTSAELALNTERVIVFKDGYCLIVKTAKATTNDQGIVYSDDVPNSAILGSFWAIPKQGTIKSMVAGWVDTEEHQQRTINCTTTIEIIKANLGKQASLVIPGKDEKILTGTILKLLNNDELKDPLSEESGVLRTSLVPAGSAIQETTIVSRTSGTHFILRTEAGDVMLPISVVNQLTIHDMESTMEQSITTKSRKKRLTLQFANPNTEVDINLMYFRPDVRWIPTYRVNLTQREYKEEKRHSRPLAPNTKTAELFMQGELLNEAEDFQDVPFHLVVGVPNFRFRNTPSPMTLESSIRNVLAQAAPAIMGNQSQISNAMYSQRASEFQSNRSIGQAAGAPIEFPGELSSSGGNDLFVYELDNLNLKKGERATIPILRTTVPYRDIYTWNVDVTHSESFAATSADSPSPLVLSENKVWRQVEIINETDVPWTTGAAMFVDGFQPLAQELLTYTSPGGICRVPVTVAVDLRGKIEDQEVERKLNALKWRHNSYAQVFGKMEIELANNKDETVPVEVKIRFGGKANQVSDDGQKTLSAFRAEDWHNRQGDAINNSCIVTWKAQIEPGECFKPTVDYEFYLRY